MPRSPGHYVLYRKRSFVNVRRPPTRSIVRLFSDLATEINMQLEDTPGLTDILWRQNSIYSFKRPGEFTLYLKITPGLTLLCFLEDLAALSGEEGIKKMNIKHVEMC